MIKTPYFYFRTELITRKKQCQFFQTYKYFFIEEPFFLLSKAKQKIRL